MSEIVKFIFLMIIFLSLFIMTMNVDGNPFYILLKFISSFLHNIFSNLITSLYSFFLSQHFLYAKTILIVKIRKYACLLKNIGAI